MNLLEGETAWLPEDQPEGLLVVLPSGVSAVLNADHWAGLKTKMLRRLIEEAEPSEIEYQSDRLRSELDPMILEGLPLKMLMDNRTAHLLYDIRGGGPLEELRSSVRQAIGSGKITMHPDAMQLAEARTLADEIDALLFEA